MSTLSLRLPDSLHRQFRELAKKEGVSINQLAASALGEKMAALMTLDYLEERARRGNRKDFERALAKVKSRAPDTEDEKGRRRPRSGNQ